MITIGTNVIIKDGSYMMTQLENGSFSHYSENIKIIGWCDDTWKVLLINIPFPTEKSGINDINTYVNNILIQNTINNELWFCSLINIKEI